MRPAVVGAAESAAADAAWCYLRDAGLRPARCLRVEDVPAGAQPLVVVGEESDADIAAFDGQQAARAFIAEVCLIDFDAWYVQGAPGFSYSLSSVGLAGLERFVDDQGNRFEFARLGVQGARLEACTAAGVSLEIPATLGGLPVVELAENCFSSCTQIERLCLPPAVRQLPWGALRGMEALRHLTLPAGMAQVPVRALQSLPTLEVLELPHMAQGLPANLFDYCACAVLVLGLNMRDVFPETFRCSPLREIRIATGNRCLATDGKGLYSLQEKALIALCVECSTYEVMPETQGIAARACAEKKSLTRVSLPPSLEWVGAGAFEQSGLMCFEAPGGLRRVEDRAFAYCSSLNRVFLNDGLRSLGAECFNQTGLEALTLPDSLESVDARFIARNAAGAMPHITFASADPWFVHDDCALYQRRGEHLICVAFLDDQRAEYGLLPQTAAIAPHAFEGRDCLEVVRVPACLQEVGDRAFAGCERLRAVEGFEQLRVVSAEAFLGTALRRLDLPASLDHLHKTALLLADERAQLLPQAISVVNVEAGNERYFVENDFLCQRDACDSWISQVTALLYLGTRSRAIVPACVTALGSFVLVNARRLKALELHDGIQRFAPGYLRCPSAIEEVVYHCSNRPVEGRANLIFSFPSGDPYFDGMYLQERSSRAMMALEGGLGDLARLFAHSDRAVLDSSDLFLRARAALYRLGDPLYLADEVRAAYEALCATRLREIAQVFAEKNYVHGFILLANEGFLDKDLLSEVMGLPGIKSNAAVKACLLELSKPAVEHDIIAEFDL